MIYDYVPRRWSRTAGPDPKARQALAQSFPTGLCTTG